eukprot:356944-Chlamydomonas_euryale.AAC.4
MAFTSLPMHLNSGWPCIPRMTRIALPGRLEHPSRFQIGSLTRTPGRSGIRNSRMIDKIRP